MPDSLLDTSASIAFQLSLPIFQGELPDLVRLVADHKVSANDVPVAEIAAQFLSQLSEVTEVDLEQAGDFVADAARLLVLKSSRLLALPRIEDAADDLASIRDVSERERLVRAATSLRIHEGQASITPLAPGSAFEQRVEPRGIAVLSRLWVDMMARKEPQGNVVTVPAFVRLETALSTLLRRLKTSFSLSFRQVVRGISRNDTVIHFLAILELANRRQLSARQDEIFADIMLEYVDKPSDVVIRAG